MKRLKLALLSLFLFFISYQTSAQEYITHIRHYQSEENWETHDFHFAFKDSQGFMWFSSNVGVYRFDGNEFKSYKKKLLGNSPYNFNFMGEDKEKNIWFFSPIDPPSSPDVYILPFGQDSLSSFDDFFSGQKLLKGEFIKKIIFGPSNFISIVDTNGHIYEYVNNTFKLVFKLPDFKINFKNIGVLNRITILKKSENDYRIYYLDGIYQVDDNQNIVSKIPAEFNIKKPFIDEKRGIILNHFQNFSYLGKENKSLNHLKKYLSKNPAFRLAFSNSNQSNDYALVSKSRSIYDLTFFDLRKNIKIDIEPFGNRNTNVSPRSYYVENKNSIWLCTHEGIYHIQLKRNKFKNFLPGTNTRRMVKGANNNLWVTSNSGLHKIDLKNETTINLTDFEWRFGRDLLWKNSKEMWVGELYSQIHKIDPSIPQIEKTYNYHKASGPNFTVNFIKQSKKDQSLWVGTTDDLLLYDLASDSFLPYKKNNGYSQFNASTKTCFFENEEMILIGTSKGIFQLDANKGIVAHFSTQNTSLANDNILFIHQDKIDGTFWLGTNQGGLIHWDMQADTSQVFTTEDGLKDNHIYAVYEDELHNLWLPSNMGMMRFDKETDEVITYTTQDGLPYDEFNLHSNYEDEDGTLFFGGLNGITMFHPRDFASPHEENAPLRLTDFEIFDSDSQSMISKFHEYLKKGRLTLAPENKSIRLSFALLDFRNPKSNQYEYKIQGFDTEWHKVDGNSIRINSLPYGEYSILLKGQNSIGNLSTQEIEIPLSVIRPFYAKSWFYFLCFLFFVGLGWIIYRWRTTSLRKEKEKLEQEVSKRTKEIKTQAEELKQLDEIKTRFFANVTHELRTPLTLILGPLKQLLKTKDFDDKTLRTLTGIAQNGEQLKNLVEEILDLSRYDANKLELKKKPVHFLSEVRKWATGFDLEAQHRGIEFQLYYQLPIDIRLLVDTKKLEKITINLLSNAFKHTSSGDSITLNVSEANHQIILEIEDTGDGIHPNDLPHIFERFYQAKQAIHHLQGGLGIGLALSKEMSKMMNGTLTVSSELGKGSTFSLRFPKEVAPLIPEENVKAVQNVVDTKKSLLHKSKSKTQNNILVVEDNASMQIFIHELLYPQANIIQARNGKEALDILGNGENVHLIISDVMMPEMDGFTLLDKLKSNEKWQMTPVIMLTALSEVSNKLKALTYGVDDYLVKPFEPEELIARVNVLFQNIELRKKSTVLTPENEGIPTLELEEVESVDLKWLKNLQQVAFKNVTKPNFNIAQLALDLAISERQLNRRVRKVTGMTPGSYLKEIRLQKAKQLLENKAYSTVAEISYLVGFTTPGYFSKQYKKRFGKLPSEYLD